MDKAAHLQYIAACEQVRLSYRDTTQGHEKQPAQKRMERRNKKYPQDKKALHGPPDKSTNFASTTTPKTSKRKQPPAAQNEVQPKPKKQRNTSQSSPDLALMFQKCHVLYEDDVWYMMAHVQLSELISVMRRNSGCTRFHFPMVKLH